MSAIDSKDSIEINCRAEKVFNVVSDYNYQNRWFPGYRCKIRNSESIFEGAIVDHIYGKPPFILGRFTRRIEKIDYPFRLEESYISGDLRGTGIWTFEESSGKTTASFFCRVDGNTLSTWLLFKIRGNRAHSDIYAKLLSALKSHCEEL